MGNLRVLEIMITESFKWTYYLWRMMMPSAWWKLLNLKVTTRTTPSSTRFSNITKWCPNNEEEKLNLNLSIVCDLEGTLLKSNNSFPYFMLVAFEGGSLIRAWVLLLSWPLIWFLDTIISQYCAMKLMIFITFMGLRVSEVGIVSRAVLPKFYLEDLHPEAYKVLKSCSRRCVVSEGPRIMVQNFLKDYLLVDQVVGTELQEWHGCFTGFTSKHGLLSGRSKAKAVKQVLENHVPNIGLGNSRHDFFFLSLCKEGYMVSKDNEHGVVTREELVKPLVFHDGRLAMRPTPANIMATMLWMPIGFSLAVTRLMVGVCLPRKIAVPMGAFLGVRTRVKGIPPSPISNRKKKGVLYVCNHRTLMDPVFLASSLETKVTAVTYSLSPVSEVLSPIKTVRLTRNRENDAKTMDKLLKEGDLVVCPEGTTCREPYLLRFSCLFAELTDDIVPVAVDAKVSMFYGTSTRGFKWLDPFFYLMNPRPTYEIHFLDKLPLHMTCKGGAIASADVANLIQKKLADALGFQCTGFTRKDKYLMLAGNEGVVPQKRRPRS